MKRTQGLWKSLDFLGLRDVPAYPIPSSDLEPATFEGTLVPASGKGYFDVITWSLRRKRPFYL